MEYSFANLSQTDLKEVLLFNQDIWPAFLREADGGPATKLYEPLHSEFSGFQGALRVGTRLVAVINSIPLRWDGTRKDLPEGWNGALLKGFSERSDLSDTLCAIGVGIAPSVRGQGLSQRCLLEMKGLAQKNGLRRMIAPVRPTAKEEFPHLTMEEYLSKKTANGLLYDPWLRTHARLGAKILGVAESSVTARGTVDQWERWTGMSFPKSGRYAIPGGLVPVDIDIERNLGTYLEPNVWMEHPMS